MTSNDFLIIAKALVQAKPKATSNAWSSKAQLTQWKRDRQLIMIALGTHNANFRAQSFLDVTDQEPESF